MKQAVHKMSSGNPMPLIGLGTAAINTVEPYVSADKLGYRHFDTAKKYDNEHVIGEALSKCF